MNEPQIDREQVLAQAYPNLTPDEREEAAEVLRRYLLLCMRLYEEERRSADASGHPHRTFDEAR